MLVDDEDYEWLNQWKWYAHWKPNAKTYYALHVFKNAEGSRFKASAHRMILNAPVGVDVDHRDGNGCNNQRYNIRLDLERRNPQNAKKYRNNASGYKGVSWENARQKYRAAISVTIKGKKHHFHLGYFTDPIEAAREYDWAARLLHGKFAVLNNI